MRGITMKDPLENGVKHPVSAHEQQLNNIHTIKKKRKEKSLTNAWFYIPMLGDVRCVLLY